MCRYLIHILFGYLPLFSSFDDEIDHSFGFLQALAQCEHTLSKLGVTREAVDDTAGAAQVS